MHVPDAIVDAGPTTGENDDLIAPRGEQRGQVGPEEPAPSGKDDSAHADVRSRMRHRVAETVITAAPSAVNAAGHNGGL